MRRSFFGIILVLFVAFIAIGFYRGWFAVSSHGPEAGTQKVDVNLTVDPEKMKDDVESVTEKDTDPVGY
ncbi:MAG: hypothetical protein AB7O62_08170 [Pirellulales bacterium]